MKAILPLTSLIVALQLAVSTASAQTYTFTIFAGQTKAIGTNDGLGAAALFNHPRGLAADSSGNIYVADTYNCSIRKITRDGNVSTMNFKMLGAQSQIAGAPPIYFQYIFTAPESILVDGNTNLYISDNNIIFKTYVDTATNSNDPGMLVLAPFAGDQNATETPSGSMAGLVFNHPCGMALDSRSNLYVADEYNQVVREVTPSHTVSILAGVLGSPGIGNGVGTNAGFDMPYGIAVGRSNTVYVTDSLYPVRQIIQPNLVTNFWLPGSYTLHAIATDTSGNVYGAGGYPGANYVVELTQDGGSNILGTVPTTGLISAIAMDADRNIYLADQQSSVIIKGTPSYPTFFNGQTALSGGVDYLAFNNGTPFGYYNLGSFDFPLFYHYDLGFEYFYDANDGEGGAYLYDFTSGTTWYTNPKVFPYLYDFSLNVWLYYYPDVNRPGHYTSNPRAFYNFGTGQIITK